MLLSTSSIVRLLCNVADGGVILLAGRSLDKIMQLKERTGNRDMFDVMKKHKKHHKLGGPAQRPKKSADMFEYLNKSLSHGKKGECMVGWSLDRKY